MRPRFERLFIQYSLAFPVPKYWALKGSSNLNSRSFGGWLGIDTHHLLHAVIQSRSLTGIKQARNTHSSSTGVRFLGRVLSSVAEEEPWARRFRTKDAQTQTGTLKSKELHS